MVNHPFRLILRRVRENVVLEIKVPAAGTAWYIKERVNLGPGSLAEILADLPQKDLTKVPLIREAVGLAIT